MRVVRFWAEKAMMSQPARLQTRIATMWALRSLPGKEGITRRMVAARERG
jgi:hypothetical protein